MYKVKTPMAFATITFPTTILFEAFYQCLEKKHSKYKWIKKWWVPSFIWLLLKLNGKALSIHRSRFLHSSFNQYINLYSSHSLTLPMGLSSNRPFTRRSTQYSNGI